MDFRSVAVKDAVANAVPGSPSRPSSPWAFATRPAAGGGPGEKMVGCARDSGRRGGGRSTSGSVLIRSSPLEGQYEYQTVDGKSALDEALWNFRCHAVLVWVLMPGFVAAMFFVPSLRPTPESGYPTVSLCVVALVVAHHIAAESRSWAALKDMLTKPELIVMGQLGVLRSRWRLLLLGILEDLDIFTDLNFPLIALVCDPAVHERWMMSWQAVPLVGRLLVRLLERLRFWGFSAILFSISLAVGLGLVMRLSTSQELRRIGTPRRGEASCEQTYSFDRGPDTPRLRGEQFMTLARCAETGLMPSVALLCEEMGAQRQWVFDSKDRTGGASFATQLRADIIFGKHAYEDLERAELQNSEERDRVNAARRVFFTLILFGRTFIGNALQLWVQAAFFQLSFDYLGEEASIKLLVGMALSAIQIIVRCVGATSKLGCLGFALSAINIIFMLWAGAKIYFAFKCEEHVWGVATGCVRILKL